MSTAAVANVCEPAAPRSPTMKASDASSHARPSAKSASPGRRKKTRSAVKERRASPPKPSKAPSTPPAVATGAVPNHFAVSAFQNSPDPKSIPMPDFDLDLDLEPPIGRVAIEQTASLRRILNLA